MIGRWLFFETRAEVREQYIKRLQIASKGSFTIIHKALTELAQENDGATLRIEEVEERIYILLSKSEDK